MLNPEKYTYTVSVTNNTKKESTQHLTGSISIDLEKANRYIENIDPTKSLDHTKTEAIEHILCFWKVLTILLNRHINKDDLFKVNISISNNHKKQIALFSCGTDSLEFASSNKKLSNEIHHEKLQNMIMNEEKRIDKQLKNLLIPKEIANKLTVGICVGSFSLGLSVLAIPLIASFTSGLGLLGIFAVFVALTIPGILILTTSACKRSDLINNVPKLSSLSIVARADRIPKPPLAARVTLPDGEEVNHVARAELLMS